MKIYLYRLQHNEVGQVVFYQQLLEAYKSNLNSLVFLTILSKASISSVENCTSLRHFTNINK